MTELSESLAPIAATDDGFRELRQWLSRLPTSTSTTAR